MTACTWPHCGCNSTQGNYCRAPSVRATPLAPALAVPEVAALVEAADRAIREAVADEMYPWFAQLRKALATLRGEATRDTP